MISEAFSRRVITPGATTAEDVAWYIRQRFDDLGLPIWFMPSVNVQRAGRRALPRALSVAAVRSSSSVETSSTPTSASAIYGSAPTPRKMGYVLRMGEREAPESLREALAIGNRWQDLLTGNYVTGRTGNEILAATIAQAEAEGINSSTYTHPSEPSGHARARPLACGTTRATHWYEATGRSIRTPATPSKATSRRRWPSWDGQMVQIKLEQSAVFDGETVWYLAGRQTEWHLVH